MGGKKNLYQVVPIFGVHPMMLKKIKFSILYLSRVPTTKSVSNHLFRDFTINFKYNYGFQISFFSLIKLNYALILFSPVMVTWLNAKYMVKSMWRQTSLVSLT